ncbi:hypothetical protein Plim_0765 [Planctopirus limnophila DSM 3776]|uniref:Uncharacterized protein n=1 Tax=Planctopirus limnophila (strain ATCC 43296 / DSM 3776 / IFAM 1008 / Mu 290) TaxID=521674 RepID=D5SRS6_PLAL2|nr:hypothetical protein [Planctopirus limnophila]ADG66610.1 hypothetical protein Plim_0765 [Planctopirus limnophila DSM 3776]
MSLNGVLRFACSFLLVASVVSVSTTIASADEPKTNKVTIKGLELEVPAAWNSQPPANSMRLAQFVVPGATPEASAELVISSFGGAVDANLNRWAAQFAADGREVKVTRGKVPQGEYYLSDITGTFNQPVGPPMAGKTKAVPGTRSLSVMLLTPEKGTFFLKLTGPDATVKAAADDLRKTFGASAKDETPYTPQ